LVHIGVHPDSSLKVRLVEPKSGQSTEYAALSYCWGTSQEMAKTTKTNLEDRLEEINRSHLPQTIKDALEVTKLLGLNYIWVDALCIVQDDDDDDCTKELAKMTSVYQKAALTISAASAENSDQGFLKDRTLSKAYGGITFQVPYRHGTGNNIVEGSVLLSQQPICDNFDEPIDRRAWTMQEHILSRRILRFGSKQTTWKCPSRHKSIDGGGSPVPNNKDVRFRIDEFYRREEVRFRTIKDNQFGSSIALENWCKQIEEFSRRKITKPSDRLPACAALAENFAYIMNWTASEYLAGLLEEDIELQLMWFRSDTSQISNSKRRYNPSWSWASLDGPITFHISHLFIMHGRDKTKAMLKGYNIVPKAKSLPYSEVLLGSLRLRGRLIQMH
jgi:hypothetical protein